MARTDKPHEKQVPLGVNVRRIAELYETIFREIPEDRIKARFAEFYRDLDEDGKFVFTACDIALSKYITRVWFTHEIRSLYDLQRDKSVAAYVARIVPEFARLNGLKFSAHGPRLFSVYYDDHKGRRDDLLDWNHNER